MQLDLPDHDRDRSPNLSRSAFVDDAIVHTRWSTDIDWLPTAGTLNLVRRTPHQRL